MNDAEKLLEKMRELIVHHAHCIVHPTLIGGERHYVDPLPKEFYAAMGSLEHHVAFLKEKTNE